VGLILGYVIFKQGTKVKLNKVVVCLGWILATACNLAVVFGMYNYLAMGPVPSQAASLLYNGFGRTARSIGVAWVIYACITGHGGFVNSILSWKVFIPLSRLTYCGYLLHLYIMYNFLIDQKNSLHFDQFLTSVLYCGFIVISLVLAFVMSLAFELPFMTLDSVLVEVITRPRPAATSVQVTQQTGKDNTGV
jgi:peptidoglycan/LPS O-acetylase OafA/YrhL